MFSMPHASVPLAFNAILGLEKQVLWQHDTPERIESDNRTHFKNHFIDTWTREHGMEWVYHIYYCAPASGNIKWYNGLLKTILKAIGGGTFKHWDLHFVEAIWLVHTRGSSNRAPPVQLKLPHTVEGDKVPVVHMRNMLGKTVCLSPTSSKCGIVLLKNLGALGV